MRPALEQARRCLDQLLEDRAALDRLDSIGALLADRLRAGSKLLLCGNGGSACDAAHFAEELTGRFRTPAPGRPDRPPLAAIACTDVGHITCTANDYGFEHVFARWVEALGRPGDALILLSTSGNSENLVRAVAVARERDVRTVALLGRDGGRLRDRCEHAVIVPGETSDRIQELHMLILHGWVEAIEARLARPGGPRP